MPPARRSRPSTSSRIHAFARSSRQISGWPTIPQVFVKGELIGGADITEELLESGELQQRLDESLGADRSQDVKVVALELA